MSTAASFLETFGRQLLPSKLLVEINEKVRLVIMKKPQYTVFAFRFSANL